MNKMCWARAAAAFLGARLCVLWMPSKGMEHVAASDLFRDGVEFVHQPSQADQWQAASGKRKLKAQQVPHPSFQRILKSYSAWIPLPQCRVVLHLASPAAALLGGLCSQALVSEPLP